MATDLERLVVRLEAQIKSYENAMKKAAGIGDKTAKRIETRFATMNKRLDGFGIDFLKGVGAGAAGALLAGLNLNAIRDAVRSVGDLSDLADALGVTAEQIQALRYASEQAGGSTEALDSGLSKFVKNVSDAGRGTGDLAAVLEANNVAVRDQSGNLRSSIDLLGAYADLVKGARSPQDQLNLAVMAFGRSAGPDLVGLLKQGSAGINDLVADARRAGVVLGDDLVAEAGALDDTLTGLESQLRNTFEEFAVRTAPLLINGLTGVNEMLREISDTLAGLPLKQMDDFLAKVQAAVAASGRDFGDFTGLRTSSLALQRRFGIQSPAMKAEDAAYAAYEAQRNAARSGAAPATAGATSSPPTVVPSMSGGSGSVSRGSGGPNDYERAVKSIKERTQALVAEANAQASANPLVTDYGFAVEKARAAQDLLTAAMEAGIAITPELRQSIDQLATGYAAVVVDAERLAEEQGLILQRAEDMRDTMKDVAGGFASDLLRGASAAEALANAIQKISDKLLNVALDAVFGGGGGSSTGVLDGVIKSLIGHNATGTTNWRGGPTWVGEKGPEIVDLPRGARVIPNHVIARDAGSGSGGTTNVSVSIATPDSGSFQRSRGQVESTIARAVARGQRGL
ncbi:hypothetical protein OSH08_05500 [Kaistia geumhonensis]|uniref:Phage tail tape measure protein n=1 Tax=Kaistia geumhonensis TaxID=410839 RepID=A0ABU0M5U3_9HYPH|nr:hypothetical protein [Kaistia geumhonensis]MCX5478448.1 hypothetical protein [Kaistia geumhonensis]MDQ0516334.1 hypothetical protein [Kaistia geumhonensis]